MKGIRRVATLLVGFGLLGATAIGQTDTNSNPKDRQNWFPQMLQERSKAGMMADQHTSSSGSTYVPLDSWIYPALDRLQALGYVDFAYLGLRPWTRSSITHAGSKQRERSTPLLLTKKPVRSISRFGRKSIPAHITLTISGIRSTALKVPIPISEVSRNSAQRQLHLGQTIVNGCLQVVLSFVSYNKV